LIAGVCKETEKNEKRVAITPEGVKALKGLELMFKSKKGQVLTPATQTPATRMPVHKSSKTVVIF